MPPLEAAAFTKQRLEDKYQGWEQTVAEALQPLYEKRELVERPDILILHGQQAIITKLEEVVKKANKEIMIAAPVFAKPITCIGRSASVRAQEKRNREANGGRKKRRLESPQKNCQA